MSTRVSYSFKNPKGYYLIFMTNMSSNSIVFICKRYYFEYFTKKNVKNCKTWNTTYSSASFTNCEIWPNYQICPFPFSINIQENVEILPSLYWIPQFHKTTTSSDLLSTGCYVFQNMTVLPSANSHYYIGSRYLSIQYSCI